MKKVFFDGGEDNDEVTQTAEVPGEVSPDSEGYYM